MEKIPDEEVIWKDVVGYEGLYQIGSDATIISISRRSKSGSIRHPNGIQINERILKPCIAIGYAVVVLSKDGKSKSKRVHRLLAEAFIPNPENKTDVNHKNGIKTDNRLENLEWATSSENSFHAYKTGLKKGIIQSSERSFSAKLTWEKVNEIRALWATGNYATTKLAKMFGVTHGNIGHIISWSTWRPEAEQLQKELTKANKEIERLREELEGMREHYENQIGLLQEQKDEAEEYIRELRDTQH